MELRRRLALEAARQINKNLYDAVEEMPRFPDNLDPQEWLAQRMRYPAKARQKRIEGRVLLNFIVRPDGSIDGVAVVKSAGSLLDAEAMRLVKSMPRWIPGRQNNREVPVRYTLPVEFRLKR